MKKRRKGNLLKQMMAVLLTAVLMVGMVVGAVPMEVFAAEDMEISGTVSENDIPEAEQAVEMTAAANAISDFEALKQKIEAASGELEIRLAAGTISMTETISVPQGRTVTLLADGGDCILQRADHFTGAMFSVKGTLKLGNGGNESGKLILDGGAVWEGDRNTILGRGTENNGIHANCSLLIGVENSEIYLYPSALLRNNDCDDGAYVGAYGGAVTLYNQGSADQKSKLYLHGGSITNNASSNGGGGAVKTYKNSSVEMKGGEISGNYAGTHGGAFQIYSSQPGSQNDYKRSECNITGGIIQGNLCEKYGGGIAVSNHSSLSLSGDAQIINNKTNSTGDAPGGGIAFGDPDTTLSLAGDIVVSGNTRGGETNNLHIGQNNNKITIGALSDSAQIGITMTAGTGIFSNACDTDWKSCFFSDKSDYKVVSGEGNVLSLAEVQTDDNIASGTDWVLDKDGVLTIKSDTGMTDWMSSETADKSQVKQVVIQNGVTRIGSEWHDSIERGAFSGCSSLASITIPSSVSSIGSGAFNGCSSLASITIPDSVGSIGSGAFSGCSSLTNIEIPSGVTEIEGSTFSRCSGLTGVTIPSGVTHIGSEAFSSCSNLKNIEIPDSVSSIANGVFSGCSSLTSVNIPSKVTRIYYDLFKDCSSLKSIEIPSGVTEIQNFAFSGCSSLESIEIPSKVTMIGMETFKDCSSLARVTMQGTTPPKFGFDKSDAFGNCKFVTDNKQGIHVPSGYADTYKEAWTDWSNYIKPDAHTHTFSAEWSHDDGYHWHAATCKHTDEVSDKSAHSFGNWRVTKLATANEEGSKERSCVCGYKETEAIPKTGGETSESGTIETDKEQGENTPDADFGMSKDDLISAVLKQDERDLVVAGTDIKIILDIDNIDASVEPSDKQAVTDKAGEYTVGQYLDISLYKIIGTEKSKIPQTDGKIKIVLTIPDSLKNAGNGKTRSYAVVRVHDGVPELLADTDNDEETITIETNLFSTYAIVYKETANTGDQNPDDGDSSDSGNNGDSSDSGNSGGNSGDSSDSENSDSNGNEDNGSDNGSDSNTDNGNHTADTKKDNEPKTGDTTPIEIYATLAMVAGLSYLILLFGNRKMGMTEQEKKELTAALVAWGRKGGKLRRTAALAVIFLILVYYHSIGKKICVEWKEVYGE